MRLCLLLCVLCLMAAVGYSQHPDPSGPTDLLDSLDQGLEPIKSLPHLIFDINYKFIWRVGHKFIVSNKEKGSFSQAVEFCSQQGIELVLPKNKRENKALTQLFGEVDKMVWINVNNKKAEGNFERDMKNRPLTFTNWGEGQPDKSIRDTGCTMMSENGVWRVTEKCSLNAYIICQI